MFNKKLDSQAITDVKGLLLAKDGLRENENGYLYWVMNFEGKAALENNACIYLSERASKAYSVGDKPANLKFYWVEYEDGRDARVKLGFGETELVSAEDL